MSQQPEALRLADKLESDQQGIDLGAEGMSWGPSSTARTQAAAELRRLHALNAELLKALNAMLTEMGMDEDEWNAQTFNQARAAIAKAQGGLHE